MAETFRIAADRGLGDGAASRRRRRQALLDRAGVLTPLGLALTDDDPLEALYGQPRYGGPNATSRSSATTTSSTSVLVSAGRFGIVYSIVIAAVRQYCLHHERRLTTWQEIKSQISDPTSALYTQNDQPSPPPSPNRYLNIVVSVTPSENFTKNLAGVTKRMERGARRDTRNHRACRAPGEARAEGSSFDALIQAPRFEFAGNSSPYSAGPCQPWHDALSGFPRACLLQRRLHGWRDRHRQDRG